MTAGRHTPVLALDMATNTGWALRDRHGVVTSGVQGFGIRRGESTGMRLLRFRRWLREILLDVEGKDPLGLVAYEQPIIHRKRALNSSVAHNLEGALLPELEERGINYTSPTPAEVKKHSTGKGNAGKPAMVAAARARWSKPELTDEDEADALCVLAWALCEIGEEA